MTAVLADLDTARELARAGVPIFVARKATAPDGITWMSDGGTGGCGYWLPKGWDGTPANPATVDAWREGDALCAVMGGALDLLDIDPRNGGDDSKAGLEGAGLWPTVYATAATPSGGTHDFVAPLGVGSRDGVRPGLDVKGGRPDGQGRGFAFIAPTVKLSKTTGQPGAYRWLLEPMVDELDGRDDSGVALADVVAGALSSSATAAGSAAGSGNLFDQSGGAEHRGRIADGERHRALVAYAGYLRRRGVGLDLAEQLMHARWLDCAQPPEARSPVTWDEALGKLRDAYARYDAGTPDLPTVEPVLDEQGQAVASWAPVDLGPHLDGSHTPEVATLLPRSDGHCLLYPGRTHSMHGESESGKSLVAQAEVARVLLSGGRALFLDFESDAGSVVARLLSMAVPRELIASGLDYRRPDVAPTASELDTLAWAGLLAQRFDLAVIDGVTEALGLFATASKDNDEVTAWHRRVPRRIAHATGAAVVLIDHVAKDSEGRGRFAIGGQAKLAALDGAAYVVEVLEPLGIGLRGSVSLRVAKDRPGRVRAHAGTWRKGDRTQEAAVVVVDSTTAGRTIVTVEGPSGGEASADGTPDVFRPTFLMEKVSLFVESHPGSSRNSVETSVSGKASALRQAIDVLLAEGYLTNDGPATNRGTRGLQSLRPFRKATESDPEDDRFSAERLARVAAEYAPAPAPASPVVPVPQPATVADRPSCDRCGTELRGLASIARRECMWCFEHPGQVRSQVAQ